MALIKKTVKIGELFSALEKQNSYKFSPYEEKELENILIQDQNNNWVPVNAGITKTDSGIKITFDDGRIVKCGSNHKIRIKDKICVFAKDLKIGDTIIDSKGITISVSSIEETESVIFYDLSVDTEDHLYKTTNDIVHHNTEICKQLADTLSMKLLRIDMSEYVEPHSVSKLIGSPPGYVGYGDGAAGTGILINALEENPHCILLLDEIEKAHPIVYNLFLQMMDNGFVTSSSGKKMSAQNIMLMMTSNAGAASADTDSIGFRKTERSSKMMDAVKNTFTPEFRNRLSAIVKFNPLSKEVMIKIVRKFICDLNHLTADNNVNVILTPAAEEYLAEKGYDPKMGARPCSRIIDEEIKTPLSKIMLFGDLKNGGMATVDLVDGKLVVNA